MKKLKCLRNFKIIFSALSLGLVLNSCSSDSETSNSVATSDALHLAFKTPDWERNINCELLDLNPTIINDSTSIVSASSASTRETFYFSYPNDSSKIVKAKYLKKYKIMSVYGNVEPFQFSQKLPLDANSIESLDKRLVSTEGFSTSEYNQVLEVKYLKSEQNFAVFRVKCKYEMKAYLVSTPEIIKPVSGTFTFKIRTTKN
ncbi:hypothetical protein [Flavobacterium psychrotolerans]|uniref:Lipoprotein n=1 Tax=Flavobacterium psychrotolerans TaxID=2169410 RepID=A0A2U1JH45_9FLAO|nr:hypothetical protein [Flavobacterium psychrotolerans]PWA04452.1 hypothetical protein DB895_11070 [Flavobacterium psychrotolerans]